MRQGVGALELWVSFSLICCLYALEHCYVIRGFYFLFVQLDISCTSTIVQPDFNQTLHFSLFFSFLRLSVCGR
ncbi:hypothetical protein GLOIN_2v1511027 [Rhizophagus irregularis DAOM 181602=DAOM 197198]|uniref:Uncharacterized protein n=1 Tax=Rhizophagus irregularis (strain DAOM 181602 / DAOM 197198 / MUCL 43194) TaxID=747089 RepID=A0A2P4QU16_RHIID|nr:hypothetical protein GLOIN_2v1511027 [Rhizophagus irregularis DAOM 181602=DAOM 197198]POG81145.1 hypothetical protein GLOIN_2v1511027 [Rhizophagus irregularis DAOM 181602=DAOM 197198]|eukprot:XP_025188011.1 hypothetical protein GLOIN_2v1511027 [Rhizophagus irregularis DAOM 181602=DAOM 197198]